MTNGYKKYIPPVSDQSRSTYASCWEIEQANGQPLAAGGFAPDLLRASWWTGVLTGEHTVRYGWSQSHGSWASSSPVIISGTEGDH